MITNRLTAIFAFIFLLSVAPNASAALCPGDSVGARQLFFAPMGGQIGIFYSVDLNHTPNAHPTCFGSMDAYAFSNAGCDTPTVYRQHLNDGEPGSFNSVTAEALCNIPCGVYFNLGGNWHWNTGDGVSDQRLNQRFACDCQPPPGGCTIEGCVWSYYECDCVDCCPLVFDTTGRGYKLTSADRGVYFDINADGVQDAISWTDPTRDVAFLAFDRNGNGVIDHGEELFGNTTPLPPGSPQPRAEHGFDALASLEDESYGPSVRDGTIDARDAAYHKLLFWKDTSHDGVSQPAEIRRASAAGLIAVETRFRESKRQDEYGNEYRLRGISWWQRNNRLDARLFYDVWFVPAR